MRRELDVILHIGVTLVATLCMPFYLGLVHWSAAQYLVYSGGAGVALATGEYLETEPDLRHGLGGLGTDAVLRSIGIMTVGGLIYLFAWLF